MSTDKPWMIYGATGYTGELIARHAAERGLQPVLAGRSAEPLERLAGELKLDARPFPLEPAQIFGAIGSMALVLNCAGPFSRTARPLMDACISAGVHYLDITGEIAVIEAGAELDAVARRAQVTLMPATGFDVVPTDCLAAMLAERLPGANRLELAFHFAGPMSRGTARTLLEAVPDGGRARIDGRIERVPAAWKTLRVPFRDRTRPTMTIPWGDVARAFYTTGIPNIEVYMAAPKAQILFLRSFGGALKLLKWKPLAALAGKAIDAGAPGPNEASRDRHRSNLWGRVTAPDGRSVSATLETLSGYQLTMYTAVEAALRVLAGVDKGFQTPARALGSRFILEFPHTDVRFDDGSTATAAKS